MAIDLRYQPHVAEKVRRMVDDALERGPYVPAHLAHELVEQLRRDDPHLLQEWLNYHADQLMHEMVLTISRSRRGAVQRRSSRSVFKNAIERAQAGEPELLEGWLSQEFPTGQNQVRKQLGDMYKEEILYASNLHQTLARGNQMKAAFLKAVANKVGARQVSEVFDNDQLATIWRSLE